MRYFIFLGIVVIIVGGTHLYFWARLVRDTNLPWPLRLWLTLLLVVLAMSLPLSFFLLRSVRPELARIVLLPVYVWMGLMLLLTAFLLATDLVRWTYQFVAWAVGHRVGVGARLLLGRIQAALVVGTALAAGTFSICVALGKPIVRRVEVILPGLPARLDNTRIVQISDLHLGNTLGRSWLEGVVNQVNELAPHLIAITGDLVDGTVSQLRPVLEPIVRLRAPMGIFFVTGNHEYYAGVLPWMEELPRLGLKILHNSRVRVGGSDGFDVAGIDDSSATGMGIPGHGPDLSRALQGRRPSDALVLLAHQPRAIEEASRLGVGLQLSGHTHGGQIWPWRYLVRLQQPVVNGLHRVGRTTLYVTDGTGFWGPPMRLGTRAEITLVTLRAEAGASENGASAR